jgi:hypothetical protein
MTIVQNNSEPSEKDQFHELLSKVHDLSNIDDKNLSQVSDKRIQDRIQELTNNIKELKK